MPPSPKIHTYTLAVTWTGNQGQGTAHYRSYSRNHDIVAPGKGAIAGSADPAFRGDASRYNPEELLVATLSSCHMLWYLHLCAEAGIVVTAYGDSPVGTLAETTTGGGHFTEVVLKPQVTLAQGDRQRAIALHSQAHHLCFIANSVNFPVYCEPTVEVCTPSP
ncbi:MAG: OsmC family protein [Cyanobacteria bacterium]|nr:OsmC family protein [Cyanobacteriota bacterium]